jgi:FAD/FMN-containing dehydrogenase
VLSQALYTVAPLKIAEDVVLPRSEIPTPIRSLETVREKLGIPILSFGHAGDGNFHVNLMIQDTPLSFSVFFVFRGPTACSESPPAEAKVRT